nr:MAG: transmembrane protein [Wufeng rodent jeilongvirus 6]
MSGSIYQVPDRMPDEDSPIYMNHPLDSGLDKYGDQNMCSFSTQCQDFYFEEDYVDMGPYSNSVLPVTMRDKWAIDVGGSENDKEDHEINRNNNSSGSDTREKEESSRAVYPKVKIISVINVLLFVLIMLPLVYLVFTSWRLDSALNWISKENTLVLDKTEHIVMTREKYKELLDRIHQLESEKRRIYPPFPLVSYTTPESSTSY